MKKAAGMERNLSQKITVLSVGPLAEDHTDLGGILASAAGSLCPGSQWILHTSPTLAGAVSALKKHRPPLVVCQSDLGAATWRELWSQAAALPDPPLFVVTSRLADEYLWAEALNLGAYDVLAKPFDPAEVVRTLSHAWLHRAGRHLSQRRLAAVGHPRPAPAPGVAV